MTAGEPKRLEAAPHGHDLMAFIVMRPRPRYGVTRMATANENSNAESAPPVPSRS